MKVLDSHDVYKAFYEMAKAESEWVDEGVFGDAGNSVLISLAEINGAAKLVERLLEGDKDETL